MNQKSLVVIALAAMLAMVATIGLAVPQAFAQVTNEGVTEDDDTTNISSTPTKVKDAANCNISGFANEFESDAEIEVEED
jgi:hypothetical protein